MYVIKRSGHRQKLDIQKIRRVISFAIEGLNVNGEELEMDAQIQFVNDMKTEDIQQLLIKTASEKVSPQEPDWTYVAGRLLLYDLYKQVSHKRGYKIKEKPDGKFYPYYKKGFYDLIKYGVEKSLYGKYLLNFYSKEDIEKLGHYIKPERDLNFTYTGLKILSDRYLIKDTDGKVIELPQEMYMLIAMTLALPEKDEERVKYAMKFYDVLSKHEITVATPTLMNARRPFTQLSSCFVLTIDDDLYDMFHNLQNMAQISKFAGGLGVYIGKIRATGSPIRGVKGASSGVIPYVKLINDTMVYVNQLGMRKGSASITLWHKDILDFLEVKTNAGDERKKAHDIHPAVAIPDIFMKRVKNREKWTLICPSITQSVVLDYMLDTHIIIHFGNVSVDVKKLRNRKDIIKIIITGKLIKSRLDEMMNVLKERVVGVEWVVNEDLKTDDLPNSSKADTQHVEFTYEVTCLWKKGLEDLYGAEFELCYEFIEEMIKEGKIEDVYYKEVDAFELWKRILTVAFETGEPYIYFRDNANKVNPNKHIGIIYSSNLCMEVLQSQRLAKHYKFDLSQLWELPKSIVDKYRSHAQDINSLQTVKHTHLSSLIPVCNLGSINLGKVCSKEDFERVIPILVRMLDNVIELNAYPIKDTEISNNLMRAIGIGVSNYHYCLVKHGIKWESEKHLRFADRIFEQIAYYTLKASNELAKERGKYSLFNGSDWSKGILFGRGINEIEKDSKV